MDHGPYQTLRVEVAHGIARVLLANGPINLLDKPMFKELLALVPQLAADERVRVVVLASAHPDFVIAHFDVGLILKFPPGPTVTPGQLSPFHQLCEALRSSLAYRATSGCAARAAW